jgi:ABC-2 type transport system permease protein
VTDPRAHAVRTGLRRGLTEFRLSLRSPEDLGFYLLWGGGAVLFLYLNRDSEVEGTDLTLPVLVLPGLLGAMVVFAGVLGPAFTLVLEREDGTLLRAKAAPHGLTGYVTGQVVLQTLGVLPMLAVILVPSALLFDGLMHRGGLGWVAVTWFLLLGLLASLPIGMVIGALARKPAHVSTWGLLPVMGLIVVSGVFTPASSQAGWLQGVAQGFPVYWLAHLMRWAFLPEGAAVVEIGGQWRVGLGVGVLAAWAAGGLLLLPAILRRMARRESGSAVEARRQQRMQRVG